MIVFLYQKNVIGDCFKAKCKYIFQLFVFRNLWENNDCRDFWAATVKPLMFQNQLCTGVLQNSQSEDFQFEIFGEFLGSHF